ncbi:MtnX-like HAD-IB family phosphatase [Paenibacillus athensensis]|uniref:phosphoserine phosphatase n=2 Tax=Paenibacillus athensensis TaxID=1967502 RepID=A0A4Y8PXL6_9BACL|nr:MtnX-like HAD-IB family phosphatase [Paenibacillus athensensis]
MITDFDGTLMEQDVGVAIERKLGLLRQPQVLEATDRFRRKEIGSYDWIQVAFPLLEGRQAEVDEVLEQVALRQGARAFLQFCEAEQLPVTILSDGMHYYIERIVERLQIRVEGLISNPITFGEDGEFRFGLQNDNPACKWCGCCKASVVKRLKETGWNIIYIGDGSSDYYGSRFADWVFARSSLARNLEQEGAPFYPYTTFDDVLQVVKPQLELFRAGTAPRRLGERQPTICRFM